MAKNTQLTNEVVNAQADALSDLADNGWMDILDGTQPATGDTAITTQVVLVSLQLNATFSGAASNGVLTANAITSGVAVASGTASWFRIYKADHTTPLWDGSVGTTTANAILPTTTINSGQTVTCDSFTHTVAKSASGY
ncbi:MAG TPA: hypothetical protein PKV98_14670 [Burkholderiaceae bacterium]|nr:hypothetical protein [Burkholderiaceae bacterium]